MIKNVIVIAIGGSLGSVLRYLSTIYCIKIWPTKPYAATFLVNIIGCLLIGLLFGYFEKNPTENVALKLLLLTGFCGGFTTFSTFGLENYTLLQSQNYVTTLIYIATSIVFGIAFVGVGIYLTK